MSLFWDTRPAVSDVRFIFWTLPSCGGPTLKSNSFNLFFRGFYWKLADGCRLKEMHTFSLVIIIQWIYSLLVGIWQFLDYMLKMLIFDGCSPEILSSEGRSCFYFKVLVNDVAPWILRVPLLVIFLQSRCLLEGSTDKELFSWWIQLGVASLLIA